MAKEKYTVFFNIRDAGNQAPAKWAEKELITGKGLEKNAGNLPTLKDGALLNNSEVQQAYFVSVEAETHLEAAEAVTTFYSRGITNPAGSAPAVVQQGTGGGGFTNNKCLVVLTQTTALKEEVGTP